MTDAGSVLELKVGGMHCGGCASRVQRTLIGLEGVSEARVDLQAESARVVHDGREGLTELAVNALVEAGYSAEPL